MNLREGLLDNFAGDLEYHPRRALVYLATSAAAFSCWWFSGPEEKSSTIPVIFLMGSVPLLVKGIFLLRKSSEGIGLSEQELAGVSAQARKKNLPPMSEQAAQIVQDFGFGGFLLWPIFTSGIVLNDVWAKAHRGHVLLGEMLLFVLGWAIRRMTKPREV